MTLRLRRSPGKKRHSFSTEATAKSKNDVMKNIVCIIAASGLFSWLTATEIRAQSPERERVPDACPLYPEGATESNGLPAEGVRKTQDIVFMAAEADYLLFPAEPQRATGQAIVVCPGGGYAAVCFDHEGIRVARWLNERGITALVLRYRMPNGHPDIPVKDACEALRTVRKNAGTWHVDPANVGIIGFSAGGHLAAAASTLYPDETSRPDFTILCYAAVSRDEKIIDRETMGNLFGTDVPTDPNAYSCEKQVSERTPPAFIVLSDDDDNVLPGNSIVYYEALKRHGIPAELHIYPHGGHGWGWNESFMHFGEMTASLDRWLKERKNEKKIP